MLKKIFIVFVLICIFASVCSGGNESESGSISEPTPSSSTVSVSSSSEAQPPKSSILTTVLAVSSDDVKAFCYSGNAPYYFGGERGLWSEMGYSAIVFSCPNIDDYEKKYLDKETVLLEQFAEVLGHFEVDVNSAEDMTAETILPDSDYMSFDLSLSGDRYQFLTIFESGDIYLTLNDGKGTPARHYNAANAGDYAALKKAVEDVRAGLDALPLDYQLSMSIYPDSFKPESTALRLRFKNIGARPVEFSRGFIIEKQEDGSWLQLSEKEPMMTSMEMMVIEPRSQKNYAIDLANLDGGQEPGRYRVTGTFYSGDESMPFTKEYDIKLDAMDISYPYPPEMTLENKSYYEKYLSAWGFYCPFSRDYTEQNFAEDFRPYLLYQSSVFQEGKRNEYDKLYGSDIPSEIVENTVTRHFPVTAEQFRTSLSKSKNQSECYDPDKDSYHFEGGYGGGSLSGVVTEAKKEGNLLSLSCDWYNMDDSFNFSHTVTIRLGESEDDFYYMANTVTKRANVQ